MKRIGWWPLLVMSAAVSVLSGCMMPDRYIQFKEVPPAASDAAKLSLSSTSEASFKLGKQQAEQKTTLKFQPMLKSGDVFDYDTFGLMRDSKDNPIQNFDGRLPISHASDFVSLLPVGKKLFAIQQFESRPGMMYLMELQQDTVNGALAVKRIHPLNLPVVHGAWSIGSGVVTAWNSHLAAENNEPDARQFNPITGFLDERFHEMASYYLGEAVALNPYDYGFPIEVMLKDEKASYWIAKHYAMGRVSNKITYIMPDHKTAYISDSGQGGGLYMFVADAPANLSAGTLYAAKWTQKNAEAGGQADLFWLNLGHATDKEIKAYLNQQLTFTDIFDVADLDKTNKCPAKYGLVSTMNGRECLRIRRGMSKAASRLETRRFAALNGATAEINESAGISYDFARNTLFWAVSNLDNKMLDNDASEIGTSNQIKLKEKNNCGAVYQMRLTKNAGVGSDYIAYSLKPLLVGKPQIEGANKCAMNAIANPSGLSFIRSLNSLIIAENSHGNHENNALWAYDVKREKLTRIQSLPLGAELASPSWFPNINGFGYLTGVVKHPFADGAEAKAPSPDDTRSVTGYLGPFPDLTIKPVVKK